MSARGIALAGLAAVVAVTIWVTIDSAPEEVALGSGATEAATAQPDEPAGSATPSAQEEEVAAEETSTTHLDALADLPACTDDVALRTWAEALEGFSEFHQSVGLAQLAEEVPLPRRAFDGASCTIGAKDEDGQQLAVEIQAADATPLWRVAIHYTTSQEAVLPDAQTADNYHQITLASGHPFSGQILDTSLRGAVVVDERHARLVADIGGTAAEEAAALDAGRRLALLGYATSMRPWFGPLFRIPDGWTRCSGQYLTESEDINRAAVMEICHGRTRLLVGVVTDMRDEPIPLGPDGVVHENLVVQPLTPTDQDVEALARAIAPTIGEVWIDEVQ